MTHPQTLLRSAARHLAALLRGIAAATAALIPAPSAPGAHNATPHLARVLELCAELIARLATDPGYTPPLGPEAPDSADDEPATAATNEPGTRPDRPEPLERPDRPDSPPSAAHLSTPALVEEIRRELQRAADALGHPIPPALAALCNQALAAAIQLQHAGLMDLVTQHTQHPQTRPPNPAPPPATTLEL